MTAGQCSGLSWEQRGAAATTGDDLRRGASGAPRRWARWSGHRAPATPARAPRNLTRDPDEEAARGAGAAPPRGRRADGRDARADEGRGDEDRPARLVHRHRVPAARVPRALPGASSPRCARPAPPMPWKKVHKVLDEEWEEPVRGAVRGLRRRTPPRPPRSARCTEAVLPGRAAGGGEDPVPRRGGRRSPPTCRTPG